MISRLSAKAQAGASLNGHLGLAFVDLADVQPDPEALDLVPCDFALAHQVLPLRQVRDGLRAWRGSTG